MPRTEPPEKSPGFWRCNLCGTPNPWAIYLTSCMGCGASRAAASSSSIHDAPAAEPSRAARGRISALLWVVVGYGLVVLAAYALIHFVGDGWWPGAFLMLSPRALFLLPLIPLAAWAVRTRRWFSLGGLAFEGLFVAGPLMGLVIPLGREAIPPGATTIRIMTLNRAERDLDPEPFLRYLDRHKIDVVCFQEAIYKVQAIDNRMARAGWHVNANRSIASRRPFVAEMSRLPEENLDGLRYTSSFFRAKVAGADGRPFVVCSLHLPTIRPGLGSILKGDFRSCRLLLAWWAKEIDRSFSFAADSEGLPTLVAGDFNQGPESSAFAAAEASGAWRSAFDEAGIGWGYTRPSSTPWARIDHVMVGPDFAIHRAWVGPDFGSDHRPMIAEVSINAPPPPRP